MLHTTLSTIFAETPPMWVTVHLPIMLFVFYFGACVGSFVNVVIERLPAGMGIINPPSRCPTCGARLRFFRENLPIFGWFMLGGKCRYCQVRISPQYMVMEVLMAAVFLGLYMAYYMASPNIPWVGAIGGDWWYSSYITGLFRTWPAFAAVCFLVAGLIAMTVIDARTFTIPIQIPLFITITAFLAYPIQALLPLQRGDPLGWPIPATDWLFFATSAGGMLGIIIGVLLLRFGRIKYSFADYYEYVEEDQVLGEYPHARREMFVELLFLTPCLFGLIGGFLLGMALPESPPPIILQALGGTMLGYIVGGGLIWGIRIAGTFAFGREAMGLGDVHLMAAVGAVLGFVDPIWIFFIAPFFGLAWAVFSKGVASLKNTHERELPYGPHLAAATFVVIIAREPLEVIHLHYAPWLPTAGLYG